MVGSPVLTAMTAHNVGSGLCSASLVAAGSNKAVEVIDINGHGSTLTIPAAHGRAAHCVALGNPTGGGGGGDAFLTASIDGTLKLWDVRQPCTARGQCVMLWSGHTNRVHHVGAALSPCGRFAACGSEDRIAVLYDMRKDNISLKLRGNTDVVLGVAFSPLHPQLATVGLDASLRFFCDR
jgi:WD40 repeat protein